LILLTNYKNKTLGLAAPNPAFFFVKNKRRSKKLLTGKSFAHFYKSGGVWGGAPTFYFVNFFYFAKAPLLLFARYLS
jgi:hypothetical protein